MLSLRMLGLALLLLVSCGAEDPCIQGILHAPSVVEYGTRLEANCSTTEDDFEELTLQLGNTSCKNPEKNFSVTCVAPVLDFEMKAECIIKLNVTECIKELNIIVYKNPEVRLSMKHENAEQADYTLHCDVFSDVHAQNYSVIWFKNNETIKTESLIGEKEKNVASVLTFNISREEKFAEFRCEVQLELGQQIEKSRVISTTHNVSARYAPELRMNSSQTITVPKGGNATLHCDVEGNPPPEYVWAMDGNPMLKTTKWLEIDQVNSSVTYSCTAINVLGNITAEIYVDVEELKIRPGPTNRPTVEAKELENCGLTLTPTYIYVKYGDPASINCITTSTDYAKMSWENAVGDSFGTPPNVTWRVDKLEDFTVKPFCFVTLMDDNQCLVIPNITLYKPPDLVTVSAVGNGSMKEDEEHQLQCDIYNVAPANNLQVTWYKNSKNIHTDNFKCLDVAQHKECCKTSVTRQCDVSFIYKFIPNKSDNGSLFTCKAELLFGPKGPLTPTFVDSEPFTAVVQYKPTIKNCRVFTGVENRFSLFDVPCETDGNPPPAIEWQYNGAPINASKLLNRTDSRIYTARVYNSMGEINTDVQITVEYRPSFSSSSCNGSYKVKVNEKTKVLCAPTGVPSPEISWFKNSTQIFPKYWKKHDSGWYSLSASNKHGTNEHQFYLDILYPPEFTERNTTEIIVPATNLSFSCKAEGNPEPKIHWIYQSADNVQETTEGRQKIITITRATSTNAGFYICVATNEFGNVTKTIQLVEKDESSGHFQFWWIIILVLLIIITIVVVMFYLRTKRHGRYDFVASTESNIPMRNISSVKNGVKSANGQS